jgi:hypothetical protein
MPNIQPEIIFVILSTYLTDVYSTLIKVIEKLSNPTQKRLHSMHNI